MISRRSSHCDFPLPLPCRQGRDRSFLIRDSKDCYCLSDLKDSRVVFKKWAGSGRDSKRSSNEKESEAAYPETKASLVGSPEAISS